MKEIGQSIQVIDVILMGRYPYSKLHYTERDWQVVTQIMEKLNIAHWAFRHMAELSGGERQKVMIARALVQQTDILILDEPTNNLDLHNQVKILSLLEKIAHEENKIIIMTMHDMNLASLYSDEIIFMKSGRIVAHGDPQCVLTPEYIKCIYGVEVSGYRMKENYYILIKREEISG